MNCPTCDESLFFYLFVVRGLPIARCHGCGLILLGAPPKTVDFSEFYGAAPPTPASSLVPADSKTESDASSRYFDALGARGVNAGRVLLIGHRERRYSSECFLHEAKKRQILVDFEECPDTGSVGAGPYDAAVILHYLQTKENPGALLERVHSALKLGAPLLVTVPDIESWPARLFGQQWTEWRPEHHLYFDRRAIQLLLLRFGYSQILVRPDRRLYNFHHIYHRAAGCRRTALTRSISAIHRLMPPPLRKARLRLSTSGMIVTAVRSEPRPRPKCSIIVPAFNEAKSFPTLMDALLRKELPGIDREIIIVESNSADGTREIAERYACQPEVTLIREDRPRGKGHAVRQGLRSASGDVILIQDADLEYDLNDYDSLLAPIISRHALLVLGTRHGGNWKMRKFTGQEGLSTALNFGHVFFTGVINLLYRQKMTDPFTMFKVFHRDCLYGLEFHCNRFDFDHELIIKLVRKGYTPLEIPVNYWSRSFRQGKKVRMFRDPFGWLWTDVKLRFERLYPKDAGDRV
jgi:hypothetical protein